MNATQAQRTARTTSAQWDWEQFSLGQDRFRAKESPAACTTPEQLRGYMSALSAASNTDTSIYLQGSR